MCMGAGGGSLLPTSSMCIPCIIDSLEIPAKPRDCAPLSDPGLSDQSTLNGNSLALHQGKPREIPFFTGLTDPNLHYSMSEQQYTV